MTVLRRTLQGAVAVATLEPLDDRQMSFVLCVNGQLTDSDIAEFDTRAERDEALANAVSVFVDEGCYEVVAR